MRTLRIISACFLLSITHVGRSNGENDSDATREDEFFTGTPDEFWQLMIACYDEHG